MNKDLPKVNERFEGHQSLVKTKGSGVYDKLNDDYTWMIEWINNE